MISPKARLIAAAALFVGWLAWLGYAALAKNRGPVVSHAQATAATCPLVAEVAAGPDGKPLPEVTVVEPLTDRAPAKGKRVLVVNLAEVRGFDGPGSYLLMLSEPAGRAQPLDGAELPSFILVGQQRSPGYESLGGAGLPAIYRWSDEVRAQTKRLFP